MRVLIIGGTGFVGTHLARACHADGDQVFITTREVSRARPHAALLGKDRILRTDALDETSLVYAVRAAAPDRVFHLAGASSAARSFESEELVLTTNVLGTLHVLRAVKTASPQARVLYVGSAHEYGRVPPEKQPITEDAPLVPLSPYGVSRAAASLLAQRFALVEGLHVVRTRSFNHTGPGQDIEYATPGFADEVVRAKRKGTTGVVQIKAGALDVVRDFAGVGAVVKAYRALLEKGASGEVYNVCSGEGITIEAVIRQLGKCAGVDARGSSDDRRMRPADVPMLLGDPTKLEKTTGVSLKGSIWSALAELVQERQRLLELEERGAFP